MSVKSERITILGSPEFKAFLNAEASSEGISVSELVRNRCEKQASNDDEDAILLGLVSEINISTAKAKQSLKKGIKDAEAILTELRKHK